MNSFWLIKDYIFANDFLRFFSQVISKKRKKSFFLKSEKKRKIRILEHSCRERKAVSCAYVFVKGWRAARSLSEPLTLYQISYFHCVAQTDGERTTFYASLVWLSSIYHVNTV